MPLEVVSLTLQPHPLTKLNLLLNTFNPVSNSLLLRTSTALVVDSLTLQV